MEQILQLIAQRSRLMILILLLVVILLLVLMTIKIVELNSDIMTLKQELDSLVTMILTQTLEGMKEGSHSYTMPQIPQKYFLEQLLESQQVI